MSNYGNGSGFEYNVKTYLEEHGYYVMRSAGSRGEADIFALKQRHPPILIQCKITKPVRREAEFFQSFADSLDAIGIYLWRGPKGKPTWKNQLNEILRLDGIDHEPTAGYAAA